MTVSREDVLEWLQEWLGTPLPPQAQADILQVSGRDGGALVAAFSVRFGVDMAGFRPRMHIKAQALRPDWPFPVQPAHGVVVPLSVSLLHAAAVAGLWPVRYPVLPPARDLSFANVPLLTAGLIGATLLVLWALPRLF